MTRKDYLKLAGAMLEARDYCERNGITTASLYVATERLADMLQADNPRFSRKLFIDAVRFHNHKPE